MHCDYQDCENEIREEDKNLVDQPDHQDLLFFCEQHYTEMKNIIEENDPEKISAFFNKLDVEKLTAFLTKRGIEFKTE